MELEILGAHNCETKDTRLTCLLIDRIIVVDVGGLTSSLTIEEQQGLKAILLTHHHFDHIRDLATFGMNTCMLGPTDVYAPAGVLEVITSHILNGVLYPDFSVKPSPDRPALNFCPVEAGVEFTVEGYTALPLATSHNVPTVGYQITAPDGKRLFYSGDTGRNPSSLWESISPDLLITEASLPNQFQSFAQETGHLTPALLKEELADFKQVKGYLPPVITVHMSPHVEESIREEVAQVAAELGAEITLGREGMKVVLK